MSRLAAAVAFKGERKAGVADGVGQAVRCVRRMRCVRCGGRDAPAGGGNAGFGLTALAQQDGEDAALPRAQHEAAAGGQVEGGRITLQVQHAGHQAGTPGGLISGPHGGAGIERMDSHQAVRVKAAGVHSMREQTGVFRRHRGVGDPQHPATAAAGQQAEQRQHKADGAAGITRQSAADFVQRADHEAAGQTGIHGAGTER